MKTYRNHLPQLSNELFITDGCVETTLMFHHGYDLPEFAAFDCLSRPGGYQILHDYYLPYVELARSNGVNFVLESVTWRASRDWGAKLGYTTQDLREINRASISLLEDIRRDHEDGRATMVISGCIGPRGDGYQVTEKMTAEAAETYHLDQISTFSNTGADLVTAFTLNHTEEAIGIVRAAQTSQIPVAIGFTTETDGKLPSGQGLAEAITTVDNVTNYGPAYYMINCAHPTHFAHVLARGGSWVHRIQAVRPNPSTKSHAELDDAEELDAGDPRELGERCAGLMETLPNLNIFGGCCGSDHRHVEHITNAVTAMAV